MPNQDTGWMKDFIIEETGQPLQQFLEEQALTGEIGNKALTGIRDIVANQGYSPQQRAMLSAAMQRSLGAQAEQAGQGLGRRAAAQGISGTGLAASGLGQIQSGLLSAQQQGQEGLNKQSLDLYLQALQSALGINEAEKTRQMQLAQMEQQNKGGGLGSILGGVGGSLLGSIFGPVGTAIGSKLGSKATNWIFGE